MRSLRIAVAFCGCACSVAWASYTYYFTDTLTTVNTTNWSQNGFVSAGASGLTSTSSGALISRVAVPNGAEIYEVRTILNLNANGGNFFSYLRASSNALAGTSGTFYASEISNPTFSGGTCYATASILKSVNGTVTTLSTTTIYCHTGMEVRTLITIYGNAIMLYVDGYLYVEAWDSTITTGQPAIGVSSAPAGNTISLVQLGPITHTAPTVNPQLIGASAPSASQVNIQWSGAFAPDPNGTGIAFYEVIRNGTTYFFTYNSEGQYAFSDDTVTAGTQYSYQVQAYDYDWNGVTTTITITTPTAGSIDPRRVGVRPTGSYWGGAGEQIDTLTGNLNFTLPLFQAMGRVGRSQPFGLSYNSQSWRQDSGGTWALARDVGYGLGWRLQAGSLTPYYRYDWTLDHYLFIDSTGAEYRLTTNTNGVWTSSEGIYVSYNASASRLYFPDGSFWVMNVISGGTEQDAGTMYPSIIEDTNGNQILIQYNAGLNSPFSNSSSRINDITDVRALNTTYVFTYNTDPLPHLASITNPLGNQLEYYTFAYLENQTLKSPFTPSTSFGRPALLQTVTSAGPNLSYQLLYNTSGSGELTSVTSPYGGQIQWAYRPFTYVGSRTFREVQYRYLTMQNGGTQYTYTLTRDDAVDAGLSVHTWTTLDDPSGIGEKAWNFSTSGQSWQLGLMTSFDDRPSAAQANQPYSVKQYTWVQDSAGNPYIGTVLTTLDPASANVQTQTTQTRDKYGNLLQSNIYDYGNLSTPARTYNNTYVTDPNYTSQYIFNRLLWSSVSNSSQNVTLVANTYDGYSLTDITGLTHHDSTYGTQFAHRGNVTQTTPAGGATQNVYRDITGSAVLANDSFGYSVWLTSNSSTNYTLPSVIAPNNNSNLQTSGNYTAWLSSSSVTGPNGATTSIVYDNYTSLPSQSTSVYGALTTYAYSGPLPYTITATTNGHWVKTTLDGFGRAVKVQRGYSSTTVSEVDTVYGPCACSPLGKVTQVSQPYAPGGSVYWTKYTYDGLGRTLSVLSSDNASTTTYLYSGNNTTITDPALNWKEQTTDAMGDLTQLTEPNPAGGSNYVTSYTYDVMGHLTNVSMPRLPTGTQTRSFVYDSNQHLASVTNPESGTTAYTYNGDATLATKTDAKGQVAKYTYDSYKRVTTIKRYPNPSQPTTEDTCQRTTITYDTGANGWGRTATAQWGVSPCTTIWSQSYAYTVAGLVASNGLGGSATYNNEGRLLTVTHPSGVSDPGRTYTYSFDSMGRPVSMKDNQSTPLTWVQNVTYDAADQILQLTSLYAVYVGEGPAYWTETRQYNNLLQLTEQTYNLPSSGNLLDLVYGYSSTQNNGRIQTLVENHSNEHTSYAYDALNRLSAASSNLGWGLSFTYDGFGNLTDKTQTSGSPPALHVTLNPATNQIYGYTYDANGNLTNIPNQMQLTYDAENRVATVRPSSGGTETYGYTPDNKRVYRKEPNGTVVTYAYGVFGERLAAFNGSTGQTLGRNVYFGSKLIATQTYSFGTLGMAAAAQDRMGSVRFGTGSSTNDTYYPYGEEYTAGWDDAEKFATYFRDSTTGLDYAQNRYYNNILGRFMSPDPSLSSNALVLPENWNKYAYVGGDPVNKSDPSGFCSPDDEPPCYPVDSQLGCGENGELCPPDEEDMGATWFSPATLIFPAAAMNAAFGGSGGGGGSILKARDAKGGLRNAFDRFIDCEKMFGGKAKVDAYADKMTFLDGRGTGSMNAAGGSNDESFAQYHTEYPSNFADTLLNSKGNVSTTVVLWADFFGNVAGGNPTPLVDQQVTLIHEFIHSFFNIAGSDSGITSKFNIAITPGKSYSNAVDSWIEHDCGKK